MAVPHSITRSETPFMHSLLYVSQRTQPLWSGSADIDAIVAVSRLRNARLKVTGALVATPTHFAQMLEGSKTAIAALMASIEADPRHSAISRIDFAPKPRRDLSRWSLAYSGDSTYVSCMVADAVKASGFELKDHAENIRSLMLMFA